MNAVYHPAFKTSLDAAEQYYEAIGLPLAERFKGEIKDGVRQLLTGMVDFAVGRKDSAVIAARSSPI